MRTTEKPSVCATTRASSFPQPGIPVRQTTRTGCEETEGSLKRFRRFRWIPRRGPKTRLTRTLDETDDPEAARETCRDRKSTRLNSSHSQISYAVFCLKKNNH